jgi:hypothetical protein
MDIGTVIRRLKCGLYGSVRDLLIDVELFMPSHPVHLATSLRGVYER